MSEVKKKKPTMIIVLILAIIIIGAGVFLGYNFLYKNQSEGKTQVKYVEKELIETALPLEEFTVNLADPGGKSFIQIKLTLAYPEDNKKLGEEINKKINNVQDIVNSTLRQKTVADFSGNKLQTVKKEIQDKINEELTQGRITNIYVNKIVTEG